MRNHSNQPIYVLQNRIIIPVEIGKGVCHVCTTAEPVCLPYRQPPANSKSFAPAVYSDALFSINNGQTGQVRNVYGGKIGELVKILSKTCNDIIIYLENEESDIFVEAKVNGIVGN